MKKNSITILAAIILMAAEKPKNELSAEVAKKYKLVGVPAQETILPTRFGREKVDFRTMTLAQADALVEKWGKDKEGKSTDFYLQPVSAGAAAKAEKG